MNLRIALTREVVYDVIGVRDIRTLTHIDPATTYNIDHS